jgi:hypothetical protein
MSDVIATLSPSPTRYHGKCLFRARGFANVAPVMFLIFVLWAVTYVGIFLHKKWTIPMAIVSILYTLAMLRFHMTDPIPLSF